jgi:hypothetical protein
MDRIPRKSPGPLGRGTREISARSKDDASFGHEKWITAHFECAGVQGGEGGVEVSLCAQCLGQEGIRARALGGNGDGRVQTALGFPRLPESQEERGQGFDQFDVRGRVFDGALQRADRSGGGSGASSMARPR